MPGWKALEAGGTESVSDIRANLTNPFGYPMPTRRIGQGSHAPTADALGHQLRLIGVRLLERRHGHTIHLHVRDLEAQRVDDYESAARGSFQGIDFH
jgi:hypothetical protein